ncbi:MAG: SIMPL domain-containing protein [Gammaproteobacteria bacterium]|nr:SIMPL domain-containing protein [Gammaproteobacteria bacterium]
MAALAATLCAPAAFADDDFPRTISVSGTGTVDATPDIARLSLAVQRRDVSMQVARDATVRVSNAFIALCKKLGIKESKIRTSGLTIQPEYRWDQKGNQQIFLGYFVQRQLEVELDNLDKLGDVIEGAIDAGVNEVSPPQLDSSRRKELSREALAAAAEDAKANADRIAASLGMRVGAVRTITAGGAAPPPMPMQSMRMKAMSAEMSAAESYTPGEIGFESRVDATFDLIAP